MKKQIAALVSATVLATGVQQARASVVISNDDPADYGPSTAEVAQEIGQAVVTGAEGASVTSVEFPQLPNGETSGESFAVYSRNADGTVGSSLFTGFTLDFDSTSDVTTATVNGSFTLQQNTGYFFVLLSNAALNSAEWDYTKDTNYSSDFGATLPASDTSFYNVGPRTTYNSLTDGPQVIQVNGTPIAVPEPSALTFMGLALATGVVVLARRRPTEA